MSRDQHVIHLIVATKNPISRRLKLSSEDDRHRTAYNPGHDGEDKVHRPDVLMVSGIYVSPPPGWVGMMIVGCVCV